MQVNINDMAVKVLVVDDDPQTLQLMSHIVRAQGYEVTTAISGAEALRQVSIARPDVMLLDVMMPEMDGIEVCRRLRANKNYADLPIVLLTAMAEPGDHADGLLAGADDYIAKPVDPASLVARIKSVLRRSRSDQPLGDLLTEIANGAVMTLGAVMAWILIADEERGMLRSAVVAGAVGEMDPQIFCVLSKAARVMLPSLFLNKSARCAMWFSTIDHSLNSCRRCC